MKLEFDIEHLNSVFSFVPGTLHILLEHLNELDATLLHASRRQAVIGRFTCQM